jgi:pimeloyl-ACP methyl ester carboxylesterase
MQLACTVEGAEGLPAVLFIAGFVGTRHSWDANFHSLARHFKLVMIDTLGFGESPKPDIDYSMEDHVRAIRDTLIAHGIAHTHIVGHSMGCLLALAYASHHPEQVQRLSLLALPYFENEAEARSTISNESLFNKWLAMDTPLAKAACTLMCTLRPVLQPLAPYLVRHVPHIVAKDALAHNWNSYSRTLRNVIFRGDSRRWLDAVKGQILLIHGTRDRTAPFAKVEPLAQRPNVQLLPVDADHGLIFSHSKWIADCLAGFLQDNPP